MQITCIDTSAGPRWRVSYYETSRKGNARRQFKTEKEAKAFAKSVDKGKKHSIPAPIVQASMGQLHDIVRAMEVLKTTGFSLTAAAEFYKAHKQETDLLRDIPEFDELLEEFLADQQRKGIRLSTQSSYERSLTALKGRTPSVFASASTAVLRETLESSTLGSVSRNSYLRIGKLFFKWMIEKRYRSDNPMEAIGSVRVEKSDPCIYNTEQTAALMKEVERIAPQYARAYAIALFAGIRPEAIGKLSEEDINLEEGTIKVGWTQDKTHQKYFAEICPNLKAWLEKYDADQCYAVPRYWRDRICKGAKLKHGHDIFRHTFASHHLACHRSAEQTTHALNHRSSDMLFRHYRAAVSQREGERFFKVLPK